MKQLAESNEFTKGLAGTAAKANIAAGFQKFYNACNTIANGGVRLESDIAFDTIVNLCGKSVADRLYAAEKVSQKEAQAILKHLLIIKDTVYRTSRDNIKDEKESLLSFLVQMSTLGEIVHQYIKNTHNRFYKLATGEMAAWLRTECPKDDSASTKNNLLAVNAVQGQMASWIIFTRAYADFIHALSLVINNRVLVQGIASISNSSLFAVFVKALEIMPSDGIGNAIPVIKKYIDEFASVENDTKLWMNQINSVTAKVPSNTYGSLVMSIKDYKSLSQIQTQFNLIEKIVQTNTKKRALARIQTQKKILYRARSLGLNL